MKHALETFQPMGEIPRNNRKQKEIKMKTNHPWTSAVNGTKLIFTGLVLAAGVLLTQPALAAGPAAVDLGSTANFTILAGAAITSTGGGIIDGDVGASPIAGSAIGIPPVQVNGIIYKVDASGTAGTNVIVDPVLLTAAKGDLTTAYNAARDRVPVPTGDFLNPGAGNIGGLTLVAGLYKFTTTAYITGSDVTLSGGPDDVWIFQCDQDLQVGSGRKVLLSGGARAGNIFWQVTSSAVLGTSSSFKGTILASQAITLMSTSVLEGRALAFTAGVTFDGTSGSLPSTKASQVITNFIPTNGSAFIGTNLVGVSAQATSLLPVSFERLSGPGILVGTNLVFTATGLVSIVASQAGNTLYDAAPSVTNTYTVLPAAALLGQTITNFLPVNGSAFEGTNLVGVSAQATSLLPVSFERLSGPGILVGTNLVFTATGLVSIVASQTGNMFYNAAPSVTNTYTVLPAAMLGQTITNFLPVSGSTFAGTNVVGLSAQATSLLPVSFVRLSGPGAITGGTNLAFVSTGLVSIVASQAGNTFYSAAPNVTNTFLVTPPLPAEPGWLAINVTPSSGSWRLTGPAGYTGSTAGTGNLAAVSAVVGEYSIAYGALSGYMVPTNHNQAQFVIAGVTSIFTGVYLPVSTDIAPPVVTATEGTYTDKVRISWPSVSGVTGYEIWKSQTNDVNTAARLVEVPDDGSATFQYDDYDVVQVRAYYYWGLAKTATEVSPMGLVDMGYASLVPDPAATADIVASDMVYLPVNATNLTTAGTVSFWLGNLGPTTLSSAQVAFDFRMGANDASMVLLGSAQRAFTLSAGQEQLVILTAQEKRGLVVPATLSGVKQVQVTVRHASALVDPNLANNTTTGPGTVLVRASGINSPLRSVNDYDGDGKSDPALSLSDKSIWWALLSGTRYHNITGINVDTAAGRYWTTAGDYDGDGLLDEGLYEENSGTWFILKSSDGLILTGVFGGTGFRPISADYDGDRKTDPTLYASASGYWFILQSAANYAMGTVSGAGGPGYEPVTKADYDGDGRTDPMTYLESTGHWMGLQSGQNYAPIDGYFGGPGYLAGAADFDGDGLADPTLYNESSGLWWILQSKQSYQGTGFVLGGPGYKAVLSDYDGDGRADPAVYGMQTGMWHGWLSGHNYETLSTHFGGVNYHPISELIDE